MSSDTIRVGVVGAGANTTSRHIPGLKAIEGVEIVSVCNRSRASSERVAKEFGIPTTYENWQDLVNAPDTNAIVIGTWPYMHSRVTVAALAANKHVMCEARMAMNAQEAHAMREAARTKPHLIAQVVPAPHTLRVDTTVKKLIAEGYLGDVLAVEVRACSNTFVNPETALHWRQDFDLSGYNIMLMGIFYEIVMRWVGEATRIAAMGKTFVKTRKDANGVVRAVRIPEHLDIIADMACGAQAHFQFSSITGIAGTTEFLVFGSKGTLRVADNKLYGGQRGDTELNEVAIPPEQEGRWRVEEEFVNAIRGKEVITHTNFEDGVKYMEFTEAVSRGMMTGQAITLPLSL
jgi:predicted dehydrogenase